MTPNHHIWKRAVKLKDGSIRIHYYVRFVDHKGIVRDFAVGMDESRAKRERDRLLGLRAAKYDFDAEEKQEKEEPPKLTLAQFIPEFLKTKEGMASYESWKGHCTHLDRLLGTAALEDLTRSRLVQYKLMRSKEPIWRHGKPVKGSIVRPSTINREITTAIGILNLAAENGVLEKVPVTRRLKEPEDYLARERILDPDERKALLEASPRWLQRVMIGADEACLSRKDLMKLTTDEVHRRRPETALIKLASARAKTKMRQKVPISPALSEVLDEIEKERKKVTNLHGPALVFTRDGQPIGNSALRKAFDQAKKKAGIKDFRFHDFRHCAVTRWTLAGIPEELRKLAAGHSRGSVHQRYFNPPDEQMVRIFAERLGWNGYGTTKGAVNQSEEDIYQAVSGTISRGKGESTT